MVKDFDSWNGIKKDLDLSSLKIDFYERQIWWCYLGVNIGTEQNGTGNFFDRPILILKKVNSETFIALPLTRKKKENRFSFKLNIHKGKDSFVLLNQIRTLNVRRLKSLVRFISHGDHKRIIQKLRELF